MTITKVVLAKLSPTMEEGTIVKWSKQEGDPVKVGDVLAEIETDKANMEMEALAAGVLRKVLVPAGGKAPVGSLIGVIANPDEDISALVASAGGGSAPAARPTAPSAPPPQPAPAATPQAAPQPALRPAPRLSVRVPPRASPPRPRPSSPASRPWARASRPSSATHTPPQARSHTPSPPQSAPWCFS